MEINDNDFPVVDDATRREAWRENLAMDAYIPLGDVTRVMVWHRDGRVGLLLARLDGRYSSEDEFPVLWGALTGPVGTQWLTTDDVEAIASLSDPDTRMDVRTGRKVS